MHLKILLPSEIFADEADVSSIVAETTGGSLGLLEHRLDCVASLTPGIFAYSRPQGTVYLAVDTGLLVKTGAEVLVSVRHAIGGAGLSQLHEAVKQRFLKLSQEELTLRDVMARMESGFAGRFAELQHDR